MQALIRKTAGGNATIDGTVKQFLRRWFVSQGGINVVSRYPRPRPDRQEGNTDSYNVQAAPGVSSSPVAVGSTAVVTSTHQDAWLLQGGDDVQVQESQQKALHRTDIILSKIAMCNVNTRTSAWKPCSIPTMESASQVQLTYVRYTSCCLSRWGFGFELH